MHITTNVNRYAALIMQVKMSFYVLIASYRISTNLTHNKEKDASSTWLFQ